MLNDAGYKLIRPGNEPDELYDLTTDPFEESPLDLANLSPEEEAVYAELDIAIQMVPEPGGAAPVITAWIMLMFLVRRKRLREHRQSPSLRQGFRSGQSSVPLRHQK